MPKHCIFTSWQSTQINTISHSLGCSYDRMSDDLIYLFHHQRYSGSETKDGLDNYLKYETVCLNVIVLEYVVKRTFTHWIELPRQIPDD